MRKMTDILCHFPGCTKIIGYWKKENSKEFYNEAYQFGSLVFCNKKHCEMYCELPKAHNTPEWESK